MTAQKTTHETSGANGVITGTVDDDSTLDARVGEAIGYLKMSVAALAIDAPAMTAVQRMRLGKLRKGGERHLPLLAQLADEWGVSARTQPISAMTNAAHTVTALRPLIAALQGYLQEVQDTSAVANSDGWSVASVHYSVLKRLSRKDPKLAAQLAPVMEFFAFRRPIVKEATVGKAARKQAKKLADAERTIAAAQAKQGKGTTARASGVTSEVNGASGGDAAH